MLRRERLLEVLRRRHQLRLILIEAPAGFGRTTLLHQALGETGSARTRDLFVAIPFGGSIRAALGDTLDITDAGPGGAPVQAILERIERLADREGSVALVLDDAHRATDAASTIRQLLELLPEQAHLVVSCRPGPLPSFARLVAEGSAVRLSAAELALRPDEVVALADRHPGAPLDPELASWPALACLASLHEPSLAVDYLREEVLAELDPATVRALGAIAHAGGGGSAFVESVLELIDVDHSHRDELGRLPLLTLSDAGCWPHPIWGRATETRLTTAEGRAVLALAADDRLADDAFAAAGELAIRAADPDALARCVRAALASQPPLVPVEGLSGWAESGLLPAGGERTWLEGVIEAQRGSTADVTVARLERARAAFQETGDADAEAAVLLHLGTLARQNDDVALLGRLLARADALASKVPSALVLQALGKAILSQLAGDHQAAVVALEGLPVEALRGDWAAQVYMVRGANLALAGRPDDARRSLSRAAGVGSTWSRAIATDLLATVTWSTGDIAAALEQVEEAERLAEAGSAPMMQATISSARMCMLALEGRSRLRAGRTRLDSMESTASEAARLTRLATVIDHIQDGDLLAATTELRALPPPDGRPVRSTAWQAALEVALVPERKADWQTRSTTNRALAMAVRAGEAAAAHLAGGPPVDERHRPFLPSRWCVSPDPVVHLRFLGGASLTRDRQPVDDPGWRRARVRELALHLAMRTTVGREGVAAALWPELGATAAASNLRVTLTHLLGALDPTRARGHSSSLLVDLDGVLRFVDEPGIQIDVRQLERHAHALLAASDRAAVLAEARQLLAIGYGPLLGGASTGEWLEPIRRRIDDVVLRAAAMGATTALDAGDGALARELADRMLLIDPWAEHAHRLAIASRLALLDFDGARRSVDATWRSLAELGVTPLPATVELARRAGFRRLPEPPQSPLRSAR